MSLRFPTRCAYFVLPLLLSALISFYHQTDPKHISPRLTVIGWSEHNEKVKTITNDIASFMSQSSSESAKCVSISQRKHGSTTRSTSYKEECYAVDVGPLDSLIALNVQSETAWIESNMNMDSIYDALSAHGFALKVTPEFKHITIGGAIQVRFGGKCVLMQRAVVSSLICSLLSSLK